MPTNIRDLVSDRTFTQLVRTYGESEFKRLDTLLSKFDNWVDKNQSKSSEEFYDLIEKLNVKFPIESIDNFKKYITLYIRLIKNNTQNFNQIKNVCNDMLKIINSSNLTSESAMKINELKMIVKEIIEETTLPVKGDIVKCTGDRGHGEYIVKLVKRRRDIEKIQYELVGEREEIWEVVNIGDSKKFYVVRYNKHTINPKPGFFGEIDPFLDDEE